MEGVCSFVLFVSLLVILPPDWDLLLHPRAAPAWHTVGLRERPLSGWMNVFWDHTSLGGPGAEPGAH